MTAYLIQDRNTWFDWFQVVIADSEEEARSTKYQDKEKYLCIPLPKGTIIRSGYIHDHFKIVTDSGEHTFNKCESYDHGRGRRLGTFHCSCPDQYSSCNRNCILNEY